MPGDFHKAFRVMFRPITGSGERDAKLAQPERPITIKITTKQPLKFHFSPILSDTGNNFFAIIGFPILH